MFLDKKIVFLTPTQHVIIRMDFSSNPYTPIAWDSDTIRFLIKLYPDGKASNFVKNLKINDDLYIRGPYGDFEYKENRFLHLLILFKFLFITFTHNTHFFTTNIVNYNYKFN